MDVMNKTPSESFVLHQLSCVGGKWAVSVLPSCSSIKSVETVSENQAVSYFFKIKVESPFFNKLSDTEHFNVSYFPLLYSCIFKVVIYFPNACFFLKDCEADSCEKAESDNCTSDMALCPGSSTDLFDIALSPLADFHYQERYRQGKVAKVSCFVIIYTAVASFDGIIFLLVPRVIHLGSFLTQIFKVNLTQT